MHFSRFLALLPLAQGLSASPLYQRQSNDTDLSKAQFDDRLAKASANMKAILATRKSGCTLETVVIRKEWNALSLDQRLEYIDAVTCLKSKAPITPLSEVPGVRSRYDDFQVTHINQSSFTHWSAYFMPYHRYFMHAYETALRDECGYTGFHPYWEWSLDGGNITAQAMFSGEVGSLGGDGAVVPHGPVTLTIPSSPPTYRTIPAGLGGGCITNGPFANWTSNLGPSGPPFTDEWTDFNPVCIERDFRPFRLMTMNTYYVVTAALDIPDFPSFSNAMNDLHGGGHTGIGGLQSDLFTSNGDPAWYLHHGQMDRVWSLWQALDFENRRDEVTGTLTLMNMPPSANGTLDTEIDLGYNGGFKTLRELASTIDGDYCYLYE